MEQTCRHSVGEGKPVQVSVMGSDALQLAAILRAGHENLIRKKLFRIVSFEDLFID